MANHSNLNLYRYNAGCGLAAVGDYIEAEEELQAAEEAARAFLEEEGETAEDIEVGVYKVPNSPGNIMAVGKNITWKRGKGKQYYLPYDIEDVGKNIKCGKWDGYFGEENQDFKKWGGWGRISSCRELYTSLH